MKKNVRQCYKQVWTHCFSVATYDIVTYYRFLNTDPEILFLASIPLKGEARRLLSCRATTIHPFHAWQKLNLTEVKKAAHKPI
jgi:hypothetical protein